MSAVIGNPDGVHAYVVEDSVSPMGDRLTTMAVQCHRFVLAEFNTHRRFSRNSASSRAIPLAKMVRRVRENPAIPLSFPAEQKGMSGGAELTGWRRRAAVMLWLLASRIACVLAVTLGKVGVHKSICNRLLEPFTWHVIVVTSDEWENFFALRCHPEAQPEIREAAQCMRTALAWSQPTPLDYDEWHLPFVDVEHDAAAIDAVVGRQHGGIDWDTLARAVSAARCARVSYLTHEGQRDPEVDLGLYRKLTGSQPQHDSPLEHVARPALPDEVTKGNFDRWVQLRHDPAARAA